MFSISFQTAVLAIAQIFAMGAVGFYLVRRQIVDQAGLKLLSFLSVNVCFPLFIFYQITHNFHPDQTASWWKYPLINVTLILGGLLLTALISFISSRKAPPDETLTACSFHNAGYIPLLMAMALPLGASAGAVYTAVILSIIGFDTCLWSLGVWLMTRKHLPAGRPADRPRVELKNLFNPPLISMALAVILVLTHGHTFLWDPLVKPIKMMGDAALALAMLVIGGNLALTNLVNVDFDRIGRVVLIKLVLTPLIALLVLTTLRLDPIWSFVFMVQACMPTAITLSIIGRTYGTRNQEFINQSIFFTHVVCLITVPIFLTLFAGYVHG